MKRLILASIILIGTLGLANKSDAQVYVGARIGLGLPMHRAYCAPRVIYSAPVVTPYYDEGVVIGRPGYGYPYYRHYDGRRFYREPRFRRGRRW
ncbi:MAG TPA: hypothetical protein VKR32_00355 [Puia sp.]|nr:hypothetical protein [Puia sp.]